MSAIVTELLAGLGAIWSWIVTTFVPASASSVTLVHFAMWGGTIMGFVGGLFGLLRRGRR
ncbi:MAG: hypothetical protein WCJ76_13530 [Comamonadaceae bacterium]